MRLPSFVSITLVLCVAHAFADPRTADAQSIKLKEGQHGRQDTVCVVPLPEGANVHLNFKKDYLSCENDEASSVVLLDLPAGRVIRLFDSPSAKKSDDWVEIRTLRDISVKVVGRIDKDYRDSHVEVDYHKKNGLKGKVSALVAGPPTPASCSPAQVVLAENGGEVRASTDAGCHTGVRLKIRRVLSDGKRVRDLATRQSSLARELQVSYDCKQRSEPLTVFAEVTANGKKEKTSRRKVCQEFEADGGSGNPPPPSRSFSAVEVFNCNDTRGSVDVWLQQQGRAWTKAKTVATQWKNGRCAPSSGTKVTLPDGATTQVVVTDKKKIGCNGTYGPTNGGCHETQVFVLKGKKGASTYRIDVQ